ncbi:hypothetical protein C8Q76DRAFT_616587 [Earliella scabrosa]|nr:hypothetical protein C8Q76DRAFT_616587 [Earliella scabrosa]
MEFVPSYLRQYVDEAIESAIIAQIGQRDLALEEYGTRIVTSLTSNDSIPPPTPTFHPARIVLRDTLPGGPSWTILSSHGQVGISLPKVIFPTSVTLDYIPSPGMAGRVRAPRRVRLWGALDGKTNVRRYESLRASFPPALLQHTGPPVRHGDTFLLLAEFEFQMPSKHVQTFPVYEHIQDSQLVFGLFVLEILDNWGSDYTCLHRVRIHGRTQDDPVD